MDKAQYISGIAPNIPFSEFNFRNLHITMFENSEFGRIKSKLSLREIAGNFRLTRKNPIKKVFNSPQHSVFTS